jgi:p-aminobenzoyl-glutamate transporter AbgT
MEDWDDEAVDLEALDASRRVKGSRGLVLVICCIAMFVGSSSVIALSVTGPVLIPLLNLTNLDAAVLVSR